MGSPIPINARVYPRGRVCRADQVQQGGGNTPYTFIHTAMPQIFTVNFDLPIDIYGKSWYNVAINKKRTPQPPSKEVCTTQRQTAQNAIRKYIIPRIAAAVKPRGAEREQQ